MGVGGWGVKNTRSTCKFLGTYNTLNSQVSAPEFWNHVQDEVDSALCSGGVLGHVGCDGCVS